MKRYLNETTRKGQLVEMRLLEEQGTSQTVRLTDSARSLFSLDVTEGDHQGVQYPGSEHVAGEWLLARALGHVIRAGLTPEQRRVLGEIKGLQILV